MKNKKMNYAIVVNDKLLGHRFYDPVSSRFLSEDLIVVNEKVATLPFYETLYTAFTVQYK